MDAELGGNYESATVDSFTVSSNAESAEDIRENLTSTPKPKDGDPVDPEAEEAEKVSKAAKELGRKGGEAAAKAKREAEKAEPDAEDEESEPEAESKAKPEDKPEKPLGNPRHDPRARMLEATRQAAELKRTLAAERQAHQEEMARIRAQSQPPQQERQPQAQQQSPQRQAGPPKPEEFDSYEDFVDARADWKINAAVERVQREQAQRAQYEQMAASVNSAVSSFRERLAASPDLPDRIDPRLADLRPTFSLTPGEQVGPLNVLADLIVKSEQATGLMEYLTDHPDVLQRLETLPSPMHLISEVSRIEGRLSAATAGTSPKAETSKAHPPVRPVTGRAATVEPEESEDEPFEAHFRRANARDSARRRGISAR